mgnify:CR=1 FL=1
MKMPGLIFIWVFILYLNIIDCLSYKLQKKYKIFVRKKMMTQQRKILISLLLVLEIKIIGS